MPFAILFVVFVIMVIVVRSNQAQLGGRSALLARGLPARGLVLSASSTATEAQLGGQRFEVRALQLDVEVPGQAPYEVSVSPMIPRICEALPGATLDLRVDRSNPNNIAIVGPAGASGWIHAASTVPGQTWGAPTTSVALPKGCGTVFVVLVGMSLALASVLSFVNDARRRPAPPPAATHAAPSKQPTRPTPTVIQHGGSKPGRPR